MFYFVGNIFYGCCVWKWLCNLLDFVGLDSFFRSLYEDDVLVCGGDGIVVLGVGYCVYS